MQVADTISSILQHKPMQELLTVSPDDAVFDAIKLMSDRNVGALLVMDGENLAGIVSERDYTRKVILKGRSSKSTAVREIMTTPVHCIEPGAQVVPCLHLMTEKRIRHLPVVEQGRVVGIVSIGDLVKRIISAQEGLIDQLEKFITGTYPA